MELNWRHHTLIQALLSRGPLKESEFHSIFAGVTGKSSGAHHKLFNEYLLKINKELAYVQLELRGCRNQYDGKVYYGIVNNVADDQAKLGTKYSIPQISFYKAILEAIIQDTTASGTISNMQALNIRLDTQFQSAQRLQNDQSNAPAALKNFSMTQKEKTLDELVRDRWLSCGTNSDIGLGIRSFLELRSWFRNNDIPICSICNEAGIKAILCKSENCTARYHQHCLRKLLSQQGVEKVCPNCGIEWEIQEITAEKEFEKEDVPYTQATTSPISTTSTKENLQNFNGEERETNVKRKKLRCCKTEDPDPLPKGSSQHSIPVVRRSQRLR